MLIDSSSSSAIIGHINFWRVTQWHLIYLISLWKIVPARRSFRLSRYYSSYGRLCVSFGKDPRSHRHDDLRLYSWSFCTARPFLLFRLWIVHIVGKTKWKITGCLARGVIPVPWTRFTKVATICSGVMSRGNMGRRLRLETKIYLLMSDIMDRNIRNLLSTNKLNSRNGSYHFNCWLFTKEFIQLLSNSLRSLRDHYPRVISSF